MCHWTRLTRFFLGFFLVLSVILLFVVPKGDLVLFFNQTYTETSVSFVRAINMLGDGVLFAILSLVLLFFSFNKTAYFVLLIVIQTLIIRLFKDGISDGWPRPYTYFSEQGIPIEVGEHVNIHMIDSFPSGHATTAFTIGLFFMCLLRSSYWQISCLFLFLAAALARVYLAQHFLIDVIGGYCVALLTAMISQWIYEAANLNRIKGNIRTLFS